MDLRSCNVEAGEFPNLAVPGDIDSRPDPTITSAVGPGNTKVIFCTQLVTPSPECPPVKGRKGSMMTTIPGEKHVKLP